jgi:hypothetical protein
LTIAPAIPILKWCRDGDLIARFARGDDHEPALPILQCPFPVLEGNALQKGALPPLR